MNFQVLGRYSVGKTQICISLNACFNGRRAEAGVDIGGGDEFVIAPML